MRSGGINCLMQQRMRIYESNVDGWMLLSFVSVRQLQKRRTDVHMMLLLLSIINFMYVYETQCGLQHDLESRVGCLQRKLQRKRQSDGRQNNGWKCPGTIVFVVAVAACGLPASTGNCKYMQSASKRKSLQQCSGGACKAPLSIVR